MKRDDRVWPRLVATLVVGFFLQVLSTTVLSWWALGPLKLQPLVVAVVSAGYRLPLASGAVLVLMLGYLADLTSGGIPGLQMTALIIVFALCSLTQRKMEIDSWPFQVVTVGVMSLVQELLVVAGLNLVDFEQHTQGNLAWLLGLQSLLAALTAPLFFSIIEATVRLVGRLAPESRKG